MKVGIISTLSHNLVILHGSAHAPPGPSGPSGRGGKYFVSQKMSHIIYRFVLFIANIDVFSYLSDASKPTRIM